MGAIIAAPASACGWDDAEMHTRIRKAFVESNPLSDYRLPVVGLVKGHKVDARLKEHFGDILIEDLPLPFFAVSTNLTQGTFQVHTSRACCAKRCAPRSRCRASCRPWCRPKQVLVDGAVLNNFPVDVMRETHRGRIIGVDVAVAPEALSADDFINPPGFLGWTLRHGFKSPPPIANLLMRAATISMNPNQHRAITDILIDAGDEGHRTARLEGIRPGGRSRLQRHARQALADVKGPLAQIIRGNAAATAD